MIKKFFAFTALLVLTVNCATEAKLQAKLQSRVGQNINDVIAEIGPPHTTFDMPNGQKMYTWQNRGPATISAVPNSILAPAHAQVNQASCDITYTANEMGFIVSYNYRGNACRIK